MEQPRERRESLFNTNTHRNDRPVHGNISMQEPAKKYTVVIAKKIQNGLNIT